MSINSLLLNMSKRKCFLAAILINLFFLTICIIFGELRYGALDDYFMAAILTGAYGHDYNVHLYFVNALYGYALLPFYHLFPNVGWYYIGEMLSVFLSFTTISYVIIKKMDIKWGVVLATFFVACFAGDFYLSVQFTQCAAALSVAGMLMIAYSIGENRPRCYRLMALGGAFLFWGSLMRWEAFLMGMPFFALGLLLQFKNCWNKRHSLIISFFVTMIAIFAVHQWDRNLYKTPEYKTYGEFQGPRSFFGDGNNYNKNAVYEDLDELGKSGMDLHYAVTWTFYDPNVYSVEQLKKLIKVVDRYMNSVNLRFLPLKLIDALQSLAKTPMFWAWLVFAIMLQCMKGRGLAYSWLSLIVLMSLMGYLLGIQRLVYRVETGLFMYACCMAIPFFKKLEISMSTKLCGAILFIICGVNVMAYATMGDIVRNSQTGKEKDLHPATDTTDFAAIYKYMDSNSDKFYMPSMYINMLFAEHQKPQYAPTPMGRFRKFVSLGYWTPYLPEITESLREFGIENPMRDVVMDDVVVIGEGSLCGYLQRHYYDSVAVDTVAAFDDIIFYKYRLVKKGVNND